MSDGSAWEREALSIKQVPSLQALLRCCDERLLVRAIVEEHAVLAGDWDALPAKRKRAAEKRLAATLATMRGLPLDKKGARGSLLLPHESFVLHARSGLIERHVSAALLSLDDVPFARRAVQRSDAAPSGEAEGPQPRPYTLDRSSPFRPACPAGTAASRRRARCRWSAASPAHSSSCPMRDTRSAR